MADSQKSIQVNIDVVVNQAKKAFSDMAKSTQDATKSFDKLGGSVKDSADVIDKNLNKAGDKSKSFFTSLQKDIVSSLAAYDLFKTGIRAVGGFFQDSIKESMNAGAVMAQVRVNIENAGLSYKNLGKQIEDYSTKQIQMGFDDEETALSVSKLALTTGSYSQALKLNQTAMNLSASKNIDLATATNLVNQVLAGNGRVLKQYNIDLDDNASVLDNIAKLNDKVKNSIIEAAETPAGKLKILREQWANVKQEVGDKLMPVLIDLVKKFSDNLPEIQRLVGGVATGIGAIGKVLVIALPLAERFIAAFLAYKAAAFVSSMASAGTAVIGVANAFRTLNMTMALNPLGIIMGAVALATVEVAKSVKKLKEIQAEAKDVTEQAVVKYQAMADAYNKVHAGATLTAKDLQDQAVSIKIVHDAAHAYNQEQKKIADDQAKIEAESLAALEKTKAAEASKAQAIEDHKQAMKDLSQAFVDVTSKQSEFSFQSVADFDRFGKVLADTKTKQEIWLNSAKQGFAAFKSAIQGVDATIESLNKKISAANDSLQDFLTSTAKDSGNTFAQIVHDAEQSIPDLQKQIQDAQANGQDTTELQKQLAEKQAVIASSQQTQYTSNQAFVEQLAFLRSQDGKNELDQAYAVMNQKIDAKKKETEEAILEIQKQITAAEEQKAKFMLAQDAMTKAFGDNIKLRQKSSSAEISSLASLTSAVNAAKDAYLALAAAMKKAGGGGASAGGSVGHNAEGTNNWKGGPTWVGERGPEIVNLPRGSQVIPNDKIAAPNSGAMTININNPTVRNDRDLQAITDSIINVLNRRDELAKMGAYK